MPPSLFHTVVPSPLGFLTLVASDRGLRELRFPLTAAEPTGTAHPDHPVLVMATQELAEYFSGTRTVFTTPLDLQGTPFQRQVWALLRTLPYGTTTTYGALANRLGDGAKTRAVGLANGRNPVGIIVPCHRVIGADGSLTGFAGGLDAKSFLLQLEQQQDRPEIRIAVQGSLFGEAR